MGMLVDEVERANSGGKMEIRTCFRHVSCAVVGLIPVEVPVEMRSPQPFLDLASRN